MDRRAIEAFELLGIPRDSDRSTIVHAYRRLARTMHPDVSASADASERFASLTEAYRIAAGAPAHQTTAPSTHASADVEVPVRRAWSTRESPIVAGPVHIRPSSDLTAERRHG
jgi:hypothetical protein